MGGSLLLTTQIQTGGSPELDGRLYKKEMDDVSVKMGKLATCKSSKANSLLTFTTFVTSTEGHEDCLLGYEKRVRNRKKRVRGF